MNDKQQIALHAANKIENGMIVGLGTGSTANLFIEALAARVRNENLQITTVASSVISSIKAQAAGLALISMEQISQIDCYVDGADEISPDLTLLKGRGADLVREKLLAKASKQFWVLADQSKFVSRIGERFPIPIEVMPFAWQLVKHRLASIGGESKLRYNTNNDGFIITSYGSLVLDTVFDADSDIGKLNLLLSDTPGIVEHGIFHNLASVVLTSQAGEIRATAAK
jgi:ribose 5-phosphate isomerase